MTIPYMTRKELWNRVDALRTLTGFSQEAPVKLVAMAKLFDARVGTFPFDGRMGGCTFFTEAGPFILLNARLSGPAVRFALAHEIGHLYLHPVTDRPVLDPRAEWQADEVALELMMPRRLVHRIAADWEERCTRETLARMIAGRCSVPMEMARARLRDLEPVRRNPILIDVV